MYSTALKPRSKKTPVARKTRATRIERERRQIAIDLAEAAFASLRGSRNGTRLHEAAADTMIDRGLSDPEAHLDTFAEVLGELFSLARTRTR